MSQNLHGLASTCVLESVMGVQWSILANLQA